MDQTFSNVENSGISYPQDFYINKLNLITSSGAIELKKVLVELSYYEDLFSFVVSGHLSVVDGQGFIEILQLDGNEFLEMEFSKVRGGSSISGKYRIYKIGDRIPINNQNSSLYSLYFCSEELISSEQNKIRKTYSGTKISDIIKNTLDNNPLKVPSNKINKIEDTTGIYDFTIPRIKPFEAISWLSTYARPQSSGGNSADMLLFETKNGYNYRSLQSMFSDPIYTTYKYQQSNLDDNTDDENSENLNLKSVKSIINKTEFVDGKFIRNYSFDIELFSVETIVKTYDPLKGWVLVTPPCIFRAN